LGRSATKKIVVIIAVIIILKTWIWIDHCAFRKDGDLKCDSAWLLPNVMKLNFIIIIIYIIRYELRFEKPVLASSNSLLKSLRSRLRPFGLQFSITFGVLIFFILATYRS
jgi:hypothetical protein